MSRYPLLTVAALTGAGLWTIACQPSAGHAQKPATTIGTEPPSNAQLATFAGGCFWCMEGPFEGVEGVHSVVSGFSGGPEKNPSYNDVAYGRTGHTEAVQVKFDPAKVTYETLLAVYWRRMDPTDAGGQFADRGKQYRPAIFVHDERQRKLAENSKRELANSGRFAKPIIVPILTYDTFFAADAYHQDYYRTHPKGYKRYYRGSGRAAFLQRVWGQDLDGAISRVRAPTTAGPRYSKPSDTQLRERLTELQYRVTQHEGTEPAFNNSYWNNKRAGIYVDVVSGEPLFSSRDKFESGTGWPSFTRPLAKHNIKEVADRALFFVRTEVRSAHGDSHLGHVFDDGPAPTGRRYCINSAALRFVPVGELAKQGYDEFAHLFAERPKG